MIEEMRKRLEEAADRIYPVSGIYNALDMEFVDVNGDLRDAFRDGGEFGVEHGYKEAIARVKEWLEKKAHFAEAQYCNCEESEDDYYSGKVYGLEEALADFEADMNKFWEEKK